MALAPTSLHLAGQPAPDSPPAGYQITSTLEASSVGPAGHLELLEDERLGAAERRIVDSLYSIGARPCVDPVPLGLAPLCTSVVRTPLRPALVRLVRAPRGELGRLTLERATAELTRLAVSRRDTVLAVRVDLSADVGSYSGPVVRFLNVDSTRLGWTQVIDDSTHRTSELDLPMTLKTGWRAVTGAAHPEILLVACRPDLDQPATAGNVEPRFTITYSRFYVADSKWHRVSRHVRGCWEDDDPFPARSVFPPSPSSRAAATVGVQGYAALRPPVPAACRSLSRERGSCSRGVPASRHLAGVVVTKPPRIGWSFATLAWCSRKAQCDTLAMPALSTLD